MKGKQYNPTDADLPRTVRAMTPEQRQAWCDAFNAQWRIVSTCNVCNEELIASERAEHTLAHAPARARTVARMLYGLSAEDAELAINWSQAARSKQSGELG